MYGGLFYDKGTIIRSNGCVWMVKRRGVRLEFENAIVIYLVCVCVCLVGLVYYWRNGPACILLQTGLTLTFFCLESRLDIFSSSFVLLDEPLCNGRLCLAAGGILYSIHLPPAL